MEKSIERLDLTPTLSSKERVKLSQVSRLADELPASPNGRIDKATADNSPSPGGEGWGEDELFKWPPGFILIEIFGKREERQVSAKQVLPFGEHAARKRENFFVRANRGRKSSRPSCFATSSSGCDV
jgi:hypothetical protein